MKDLRIIFMGTPDFAVASLQALFEAKFTIVGVITAPDKPAGRGRKLNESAVKKYALEKKLNILQPTNLKDSQFLELLKNLNANLQVVVAFRMLPQVIWKMPEFGTFNLHASLLPNYRGAAPINWAIINGEEKTGVTTFFLDEKIDTGEIILQEEVTIAPDETAGELHDKLMSLGSSLVLKTANLIKNGTIKTFKQLTNNDVASAPKIYAGDCKIDWTLEGNQIHNFIRGLSPYPVAWSLFKNNSKDLKLKIYQTHFKILKHTYNIGKIISSKNELKVACKDGVLTILSLQLPGKRKMTTKELLNGYTFADDAIMI